MDVGDYGYLDPDAQENFYWDWEQYLLPGDSIATSTFTLDTGLTEVSRSNDSTKTRVKLSASAIPTGKRFAGRRATNRIVTAQGETQDWTRVIVVREQ